MNDFKKQLMRIASLMEVIIAILVLLVVIVSVFVVFINVSTSFINKTFDLETFMGTVLTLVVGVEFAKMLLLHTPESVIEVLLYTVARQIILSHDSAMENLIGVLAVALIFVLRSSFLKEFFLQRKLKNHSTKSI